MQWIIQQVPHRGLFDQIARIHHEDALGKISHRGKVVGDVDDRKVVRFLQAAQQLQDFHAHRGIQHRDRFVRHDQLRLQDHGPGDHHALLLPAAEHVRELLQEVVHRVSFTSSIALWIRCKALFLALDAADDERLLQDALDVHEGRQRAVRVLLDIADL